MYKLLMADDEEIIRRGFANKVDWNRLGFEFLPPCRNGEELLDGVSKYSPDVVLTDICMPDIDGLEAASIIAEDNPRITIIIISGYDDFEYAQKAIRNRVWEYVLKPVNRRQLEALLERLREKLDRNNESDNVIDRLSSLMEENRELLAEQFLRRLLLGYSTESEIAVFLETYGSAFRDRVFAAMTVYPDALDSGAGLAPGMSFPLYYLALKKIVESLCEKDVGFESLQNSDGTIILIFHHPNSTDLNRLRRVTPDRVIEKINDTPELSSTIGIGSVYRDLSGLVKSYHESLAALKSRFVYGTNSVIFYSEKPEKTIDEEFDIGEQYEKVINAFSSGSSDEGKMQIRAFFRMLQSSSQTVERLQFETRKLYFAVFNVLEQMELTDVLSEEENAVFQQLKALPPLEKSSDILVAVLEKVVTALRLRRQDFSVQKIEAAKRYIESNYHRSDLTIDDVCSELFISAGYLSRIFKKKTGSTFISYLTEYRIQKACELIRTTCLKNYEIAERVGYRDAQYFSTVFKKALNRTLSEYRSVVNNEC